MRVYKYNWAKTRVWLGCKVKALSAGLREQGVYVGAGSMSSSLVSSKQTVVSNGESEWWISYTITTISFRGLPEVCLWHGVQLSH